MPQKLLSEIRRIELDDATFAGTGAELTPTYVNFFFGNNGTGKSTIAKVIKTGRGITYADGKHFEDYLTLVYNQEFINENMRSYHDLRGIFTFDEVNSEIQAEVDRLNEQLRSAMAKRNDAVAARDEAEKRLSVLDDRTMKRQYTSIKGLRDQFNSLIPANLRNSQKLIPLLRQYTEKEATQDLEEMKGQYDAIFGGGAREYEEFRIARDITVLDIVPDAEILDIVIANAAETEFARFLGRIGATQWMRQAHEKYHGSSEGRCPYCFRELDSEFEQMFIESFDDQYEKNISRLNAFLTEYRDRAKNLYLEISKLPAEIYPGVDDKAYRDKLEVLKSMIKDNIDTIRSKVEEPSKRVVLVEISPSLKELSVMAEAMNIKIRSNNVAFNAQKRLVSGLRDNLYCHMASALQWEFREHDRQRQVISKELASQEKIISEQKEIVSKLKEDLRGRQGSVKDTSVAMQNINSMLRDANFQGFELRPHVDSMSIGDKGVPINYAVVRTSTGEVVVDLSEGEKNFIAFLYFLQKVYGSETNQKDPREKIVVIDDPVSSMDSGTLFIVGEQVRKLVEVCRNNADNRNALVKGNFIKQIFVLTHNAYFHREITYPHADRYEFVSFYLVRKVNNRSSVRLIDKQDPNTPTRRINVNPVKNSYAALWEEYKEVSSAVPLMNAMRRILEYYFMQICGYEGGKLRETILEENREAFTHDELGQEDNTRYDMASMMLSYIDVASYGINDGLHYVDDGIDVDLYRETFRMIFEYMHQEQHYKMMMGIK